MFKNVFKKVRNIFFNHGKKINNFYYGNPVYIPTLIFNITTRCNFACPHCLRRFNDGNKTIKKDIPLELFESILSDGKKMNFEVVSLTGGECILHPEFKNLIKLIDKYKYKFTIVSNGWFFKEYFEILKNFRKDFLNISLSLDGVDEKTHDNIRNKPGSFDKVIEAIKFFKEQNIPIGISTCINKKNYDQVQDIVDLCLKFNINYLKFETVATLDNDDPLSLDKKEKEEFIAKIFRIRKDIKELIKIDIASLAFSDTPIKKRNFNFCPILFDNSIYIDYDGAVSFCCDIYKKYKRKFLIKDLGLEKAIGLTLDVVTDIKKNRLSDLLNDSGEKDISYCEYCNRYVEKYLNK